MIPFNYRKAVQTMNYFAISEGGKIDKLKLIKLIWLADRYHLRTYGRPILMDYYYAMDLGPIPSHTKDLTKQDDPFLSRIEIQYRDQFITPADRRHRITSISNIDNRVFSKSELEVLKIIFDQFGGWDNFDLSNLSHEYPEWKKFEVDIKNGHFTSMPMNYLDFFENPQGKNQPIFDQEKDHLSLTKEIFEDSLGHSFCNSI